MVQLNNDQLRRARKSLARAENARKMLEKCKNCGIPVDDAYAVLEENVAKIHALVREFGPPTGLQEAIGQMEQNRSGTKPHG